MSSGWILILALALFGGAAVVEILLRRSRHIPLSRHAVNKRRYDDPTTDKSVDDIQIVANTWTGRDGTREHKTWKVAKRPEDYNKAMAPNREGTQK